MKRKGFFTAGTFLLWCMASFARATVTITVIAGSGSVNVLENVVDTGQRNIQFEVDGTGEVTFRVRATAGTEPIRYIKVRLNSGVTTGKLVVNENGGTITYVREISRLSGGSSTADFWLNSFEVTGDLGGPGTAKSGTCVVNHIVSVDCGGDITADIHLEPFPSGSTTEHEIVLMRCDGDFYGDIRVDAGRLRTLTVGGNIGSATVTPLIKTYNFIQQVSADEIWADFEVAVGTPGASEGNFWKMTTTTGGFHGSIKAGRLNGSSTINTFNIAGDWDADVTLYRDIATPVNIDGDFPSGTVWTIGREIRTGYNSGGTDFKNGEVNIEGDFAGTIFIEEGITDTGLLGGPMTVGGDFESTGLLFIESSILYNDAPFERRGSLTIDEKLKGMVFIGEDLDGPIWVKNLGSSGTASGLSGQIVINGLDNGSEWLDDVSLGNSSGSPAVIIGPGESQPYQAPYYEALSSTLGGGAIGLVPFMYHAIESAPNHGTVITTGGFTGNVTIEHYGPVADGDGNTSSTPPVKVYELALQVPCCDPAPNPATTAICDEDESEDLYWTDVTSSYSYSVSGRVVTVSGTFSNWKAYQFIPVDLVCDIDGEPVITYAQGWLAGWARSAAAEPSRAATASSSSPGSASSISTRMRSSTKATSRLGSSAPSTLTATATRT